MKPTVVNLMRYLGGLAALWGIAYVINGITQAGAYVRIQVNPAAGTADQLRLSGVNMPYGVKLDTDQLPVHAWGSTVLEQALSRGDVLLAGLCAFAGALLLERLLMTFLQGRPFAPGNAAKVGRLAALVVVAGVGGPLLPTIAAWMALNRTALAGTFTAAYDFSPVPPAIGLILTALAVFIRSGRTPEEELTAPRLSRTTGS
ncbi:hypothetical protein Sru01_11750 [Sphaerisporangium rufum]|uniref:DUF2975 domain-containing protein n=1 Tax=Sphaerisporangium rufum TaxID=1381558 RepID=A0A919QZH4_9ACTN|nr:hypothetical protein [Sphaerisporangium rufum]GII76193.1 hypothetical protein Sru01_11750 [Sphaerisporangium rufum]